MNPRERCEALAYACAAFPWLGISRPEQLLELVRQELGSEEALEGGIRRGNLLSRAVPPAQTLHIVSGNTPHAALQSLTRGLLLGGLHRVKVSAGIQEEIRVFLARLPKQLTADVVFSLERRSDWLEAADCVVVFGSDETLAAVQSALRPGQRLIAHGHKEGYQFVTGAWDAALVLEAANDVCDFDQMGCLSPVACFVERDVERFAQLLADVLEEMERRNPRGKLSAEDSAQISLARNEFVFHQRSSGNCHVWMSKQSTAWTVVADWSAEFPSSPLHRFILVKPLPADLGKYFEKHRRHLSTAGTNSEEKEFVSSLFSTGFQRVCPLGRMQEPPVLWHHDGYAPLASRVTWVDWEYPG